MVEVLDIAELDVVMKIWLEANIQAHNFIAEDFWKNNYELVKTLIPRAEVWVYKEDGAIKGFIGVTEQTHIDQPAVNFYAKHGFKIELTKENRKVREIEFSMVWERPAIDI